MGPQAGLAEVPPLLATLGFLLAFLGGGLVGSCRGFGSCWFPVVDLAFPPLLQVLLDCRGWI